MGQNSDDDADDNGDRTLHLTPLDVHKRIDILPCPVIPSVLDLCLAGVRDYASSCGVIFGGSEQISSFPSPVLLAQRVQVLAYLSPSLSFAFKFPL